MSRWISFGFAALFLVMTTAAEAAFRGDNRRLQAEQTQIVALYDTNHWTTIIARSQPWLAAMEATNFVGAPAEIAGAGKAS